jgi:hypothetical protein
VARKPPRERGILFGRGDALAAGVEEPPTGAAPVLPWYGAPIPFGDPPPWPIELAPDELPWELRDDPAAR